MDVFNGVRANRIMAAYCFHVLEARLKRWKAGVPCNEDLDKSFNVNGLFVTYEKLDGDLRGCIGTFAPGNLKKSLEDFSLTSALRDSRFRPIDTAELPTLKCSITVLSEMSKIDSWDAWVPGKHGIYITLRKSSQNYSATFLPSVIVDQGWSKHQTFEHLLAKSGYRGEINKSVFQQCEVQTYEGSKDHLTYDEYKNEFREKWGFDV
eukprot:TRINITY_DN1089_c6_g1_i1.p1 TRINITY_DN1089_c6_g1~~TRINITY_DN1089_c6_g1_i1.p1  ORF type:complete len:222 (+),score=37.96 TRINITY_DN1089_c6_g1_i1:46-666(+)